MLNEKYKLVSTPIQINLQSFDMKKYKFWLKNEKT